MRGAAPLRSANTTSRCPELIIVPRVGHGCPGVGVNTNGSSPAASNTAAVSSGVTESSMNRVTTSRGWACIQARMPASTGSSLVEPVSHSPWHR